ncbi:MAG: hypothetical protein O2821_05990 [Chloroflexi bacterium]|nr:hypothetical protein [Chloroflexota bacterium]MDA1227974.1 hypothetical protein [Chloroflexota bacterium]
MQKAVKANRAAQIELPGMPRPRQATTVLSCCDLVPGQQVVYVGKIMGGPRYGIRGIVTQALQRKAVVDMGRHGTWNVPYFFLTLPQEDLELAQAA